MKNRWNYKEKWIFERTVKKTKALYNVQKKTRKIDGFIRFIASKIKLKLRIGRRKA